MSLLLLSLLMILGSSSLLILSSSLPLQALALLLMSGATAAAIASSFSILLGIYTILIYASGLLVLLAYFVALSPNQNLNTPSRFTFLTSLSVILFILLQTWPNSTFYQSSTSFNQSNNVITILSPYSSSLLIMIALMLVLTMIAVVKVSSLSTGPIRPWSQN
uniref:NADH dehydrogenase subunit 6 n=1 Tax=Polydora hoplura TaxID=1495204 RepID=A0A8F9WN15_9ANNE|nr:NADH dehydrogenase subunit 6 [Polydora hoplura]QYL01495.1 NADH dehydrogenase subunit 6 [Polydora hoplura]